MSDTKSEGREELGTRIRTRRLALGLTLAQVAEESGLSLPYVSNLERGRGNPTIDVLRSIAGALEQPVSALLGGQPDKGFDIVGLVLAEAPKSLGAFTRTARFKNAVKRLAPEQGISAAEMGRRLVIGMASAPRRSEGDPTDEDWRRLLDAYSLILGDE